MMKWKYLLHSVFISLIILAGCSSKVNEPQKVLSDFIDAMKQKDFAKAEKLSTAESKEYFIVVEKLHALSNSPYLQDSNYFNKSNINIGEATLINEIAHIPVSVKIKDSTINPVYTLKKENGEWKVAFDFGTQAGLKAPGK